MAILHKSLLKLAQCLVLLGSVSLFANAHAGHCKCVSRDGPVYNSSVQSASTSAQCEAECNAYGKGDFGPTQ